MGAVGAGHHGTNRDDQTFSRLLVGESQKVGRPEYLPFFDRDPVERRSDFPGLPGALEGVGENRHLGLFTIRIVATFPAVEIDGHPAGNRIQPRCRITLGVELACRSPRLQESLLDSFLGEAPVTERSIRHGEDGPPVAVVQVTDGSGISIPEPPYYSGADSLAQDVSFKATIGTVAALSRPVRCQFRRRRVRTRRR